MTIGFSVEAKTLTTIIFPKPNIINHHQPSTINHQQSNIINHQKPFLEAKVNDIQSTFWRNEKLRVILFCLKSSETRTINFATQVCVRLYHAKKRMQDPELDNLINPHEVLCHVFSFLDCPDKVKNEEEKIILFLFFFIFTLSR